MILLNKLYLPFPVREISWDCLSSWIAEPRAKRRGNFQGLRLQASAKASKVCCILSLPKFCHSSWSLTLIISFPLLLLGSKSRRALHLSNVTTWLLPPMSFMLFPFLFKSFVDFVDFLFWFDRIWQDTFCYFLPSSAECAMRSSFCSVRSVNPLLKNPTRPKSRVQNHSE